MRTAVITRTTAETEIALKLKLDEQPIIHSYNSLFSFRTMDTTHETTWGAGLGGGVDTSLQLPSHCHQKNTRYPS